MFERLVKVSEELSRLFDEIEHDAFRKAVQEGRTLRSRQYQSVLERTKIARSVTGDQLSMLMREVKAVE